MKTVMKEERPAEVRESPKQFGKVQIRERWRWTERMLTDLEKGVKGGKWFSLVDKVYSSENLRASWAKYGYSRDGRGDCKQVVVGLVVDEEGFNGTGDMEPLHNADESRLEYDKTTLTDASGSNRIPSRCGWHPCTPCQGSNRSGGSTRGGIQKTRS